jgi:RNA polymerase sigma-70 factor (ECF subfamily)
MQPGNGPDAEFSGLLRPHLDRLYRLAFRLTGTAGDAEDLVQDVLCKVYERHDELTSIGDLGPWLARVLYNRFIDDARKRSRQRLVLVDSGNSAVPDCPDESCGSSPESAVDSEFSIRRLNDALGALSPEHRTVVLLHDAEGYKLTEIQSITGVSLGTLKSRLHRARARLREILVTDGTF